MTKLKIEVEDGSIKEPLKVGVLKPYFYRRFEFHEFLVPKEEIEEFDKWAELDTESDEFYEHEGFDHYMVDGIEQTELFIKVK